MSKVGLENIDGYFKKKLKNKEFRKFYEIERKRMINPLSFKKKSKKLNCVATDKCQINFEQK